MRRRQSNFNPHNITSFSRASRRTDRGSLAGPRPPGTRPQPITHKAIRLTHRLIPPKNGPKLKRALQELDSQVIWGYDVRAATGPLKQTADASVHTIAREAIAYLRTDQKISPQTLAKILLQFKLKGKNIRIPAYNSYRQKGYFRMLDEAAVLKVIQNLINKEIIKQKPL
jgi:hypothetical protein